MSKEAEERVAKLIDPEAHFKMLAEQLRIALDFVNQKYKDCQQYGLVGDWYIGPNLVYTHLPDKVVLKRTKVSTY